VPLTGISFFITVFFIKRVPLKRGDEAALKAEAKRWMEEKKHKQGDVDVEKALPPSSERSDRSERTLMDENDKEEVKDSGISTISTTTERQ